MNTNFADRLAELRRSRGLEQEDIANVLGVSVEKVSDWESGNSSPNVEELTGLADYFAISVDELVRGTNIEETVDAEVVDEDEQVVDGAGPRPTHAMPAVIGSILFVVALIVYLILGFTWTGPNGGLGWAAGWTVFLLPIIIGSIVSCIHDHAIGHFQIVLLIIGIYCDMGIIGGAYGVNFWHPWWVMFFFIPLFHFLAGIADRHRLSSHE